MSKQPLIGYVWARESNEHDKEIYSIKEQVEQCLAQAKKDGVTVPPGNIFRVQFSGVNLFKIPDLKRLWQRLEADERPKIIYCWVQDRMIRGKQASEIFYITTRLREANTKLFLVKKQIDLTAANIGQEVEALIDGHKASSEVGDILDRTWTRGRLRRIKEGKIPNFGPAKFGYKRIRETGKAVIIPEQAAIIRKFAKWIDEGIGAHGAARKLNEAGIPSIRGKKWSDVAIRSILRDPSYKGEGYAMRFLAQKETRAMRKRPPEQWIKLADDAYPPILDAALWDRINQKLNDNHGTWARQEKRFSLLRGLLRCYCGAAARPKHNVNAKGAIYDYYICSRVADEQRRKVEQTCFAKMFDAEELEAAIWNMAVNLLGDPKRLIEILGQKGPEETASTAEEIAGLERAAESKLAELKRLANRLRTASDSIAAHIEEEMNLLEQERRAISNQIAECRAMERAQSEREIGFRSIYELAELVRNRKRQSPQFKRKILEGLPLRWRIDGTAIF